MQNSFIERWQALLTPEAQLFLTTHKHTALDKLALQRNKFPQIPFPEVLEQLDALRKLKDKIPAWVGKTGLLFPALAYQQASSELTAQYKSILIAGRQVADLTGGLGVDSFFLAQQGKIVHHIEAGKELHEIVKHNFETLQQNNIICLHQTAEEFLQHCNQFDAFYIDPARRGKEGQKLVLLTDYTPNILAILPAMFAKTQHIWLKTSPLLDITQACEALACVKAVYVIAHGQEVKELLFHLAYDHFIDKNNLPTVYAVTLTKDNVQTFSFSPAEENGRQVAYHQPLQYIYEPLPAILKAGAFKSFAERYDLYKLHVNSHFYTSEHYIQDIPARIFALKNICGYKKEAIKKVLPTMQANIIARNFRDTVAQIRQKLKITDGGENYLLATTLLTEEQVILLVDRLQ